MMPEEEKRIWQEGFMLYEKYRSREMKEDDWKEFAREIDAWAVRNNWKDSALVKEMGYMLLDVFDAMYRNGCKPKQMDFFGRDDLDGD